MHMFNDPRPFSPPPDPHSHKANHDTNERKLHSEGPPSLWRQISNLLILAAIIAGIVLLVKLFQAF